MPGVRVGRHARIRRAIIDRDVLIPRGALIGYNLDEDRRATPSPTDGVVVVTVDEEPLHRPDRRRRRCGSKRKRIGGAEVEQPDGSEIPCTYAGDSSLTMIRGARREDSRLARQSDGGSRRRARRRRARARGGAVGRLDRRARSARAARRRQEPLSRQGRHQGRRARQRRDRARHCAAREFDRSASSTRR